MPLTPRPAASLRPGIRWQRGDRFPDDPDVECLYRILYAQGEICARDTHLPEEAKVLLREIKPVARFLESGEYIVDFSRQDAVQDALARRSGEDGFGILGYIGGQVVLGLPLDEADLDPWPEVVKLASKHYQAMRAGNDVLIGPGPAYNPFAGVDPTREIIGELERRAGRDGYRIERRPGDNQGEYLSLFPKQEAGSRRQRLAARSREILEIAARYGASNVRVFGSIARGEDTEASDIDLLVDLPATQMLLSLAGLGSGRGGRRSRTVPAGRSPATPASDSRRRSRARWTRILAVASEQPTSSAISALLRSWASWRRIATR